MRAPKIPARCGCANRLVGGAALVGGSVIALASATFPLVVLLPIADGAWMAFRGYFEARRIDEERILYGQMAERMGSIVEVA